jgi:anthranilate/para-aminobenzoate synthase component I
MEYLEKYVKDLDEIKKMNIIYPIINLLYNSRHEGKIKIEVEFNKISNAWKDIEEMITKQKTKKMRKDDKKILIKYFNDEKNKDLLIKIFSYDSYEFFKKQGNENPIKNNSEIKQILNYYKNFLFESKKKDIKLIENAIEDCSIELNLEEYLKDLDLAKKMNNRYFIINKIYNAKYKDIDKEENKLNEIVKCWENYEKMIKDKKFKKMRLFYQNIIFQSFKDINNKDSILNIFEKDVIQMFIDDFLNKNNKQSYFNI